jgi:hypothetical protein
LRDWNGNDFPTITIAAFWERKLPPLAQYFFELFKKEIQDLAIEMGDSGYKKNLERRFCALQSKASKEPAELFSRKQRSYESLRETGFLSRIV